MRLLLISILLIHSLYGDDEPIDLKHPIEEMKLAFGLQVENEFNLRFNSFDSFRDSDVITNGKIEKLEIDFYTYHPATIEEARALGILITNKFVQAINASGQIHPYLKDPFTVNNVKVGIRYEGADRNGSISNIWWNSNYSPSKFVFISNDPFRNNSRDPYDQETFEEALSLSEDAPLHLPKIHETSELEEEMNHVFSSYCHSMWMNNFLSCRSIGGNWNYSGKKPLYIEKVEANFTYNYPVTKEEARILLSKATETLIDKINRNPTLKPFLIESFFPLSRLKIRIEFDKYATNDDVVLEKVDLENNQVTYDEWHRDKDDRFYGDLISIKESYEDSLKIYKNTPPATFSQLTSRMLKIGYYDFKAFWNSARQGLPLILLYYFPDILLIVFGSIALITIYYCRK